MVGEIQNIAIPHNQTSIDQWIPSMKSDSKPTPKKHIEQLDILPEYEIDEIGFKFPKEEDEEKKVNEEDMHEPVNRFTRSTRGKKAREIPDDEKQKYLEKDLYRELVTLEREYHDEMFPSYGKSYNRMNKLKGMVEKNKKSGKTF